MLVLLLVPVPADVTGLLDRAVLEIYDAPLAWHQGFPVNGAALAPEWGHDVVLPTARLWVEDWRDPGVRCALHHEAMHLAIGPDPTATDPDGYWQERRVYADTRAAVGDYCPAFGGDRGVTPDGGHE